NTDAPAVTADDTGCCPSSNALRLAAPLAFKNLGKEKSGECELNSSKLQLDGKFRIHLRKGTLDALDFVSYRKELLRLYRERGYCGCFNFARNSSASRRL